MPTCGRRACSAVLARSRAAPPPFATGYVASTIVQPFSCGHESTRWPRGAAETVTEGATSGDVSVTVRGAALVVPPVAAMAAAAPAAAITSAASVGQIQSPG